MPDWLALLPRRVLSAAVRFYRYFLAPWLGGMCLYEPTCSSFALQALERHGAAAGTWLAAGRVLRCRPWCAGGCDPVPEHPPRLFAFLSRAPSGPLSTHTSTNNSS